MVKEPDTRTRSAEGVGVAIYVLLALVALGGGLFWYLSRASPQASSLELSPEAKQYVRNLKLSGVNMKATESYMKQTIVEIEGQIANAGDRSVDTVELYCVFHDVSGTVILRERVPIVKARDGALKPSNVRAFRLPFDAVPESWNHEVPQLIIAGIRFSS